MRIEKKRKISWQVFLVSTQLRAKVRGLFSSSLSLFLYFLYLSVSFRLRSGIPVKPWPEKEEEDKQEMTAIFKSQFKEPLFFPIQGYRVFLLPTLFVGTFKKFLASSFFISRVSKEMKRDGPM